MQSSELDGNIDIGTNITTDLSMVLKGIAITLVILCHVGNQFTYITTPLGGIGVSIFLVLSAYGLSSSFKKNGLNHYWQKRILSVFIPYAIVEIITIPLRKGVTPINFILDVLLVYPQLSIGWYLGYQLLWYIIFWCVFSFQIDARSRIRIVLLISIGLSIYFFQKNGRLCFEQSYAFLIGLLFYYYNSTKYINIKNSLILILLASIVLFFKQIDIVRSSEAFLSILDLFIKLSASIGIILFIYCLQIKEYIWIYLKKIAIPIGAISYELYLVHGYLLGLFELAFPKIASAVIVILASIPIALGLSYISLKIKKTTKSLLSK